MGWQATRGREHRHPQHRHPQAVRRARRSAAGPVRQAVRRPTGRLAGRPNGAPALALLGLALTLVPFTSAWAADAREVAAAVAPATELVAEPATMGSAGEAALVSGDAVAAGPAPDATSAGTRAADRPATPYELAAARYGVSELTLRALHQVESNAAIDRCVPNMDGSGAIGPFQFKPATFRAYGVDADGDGRADICGFADSLHSAARYLQALGGDADPAGRATERALRRYGTDVERVVSLAGGLATNAPRRAD